MTLEQLCAERGLTLEQLAERAGAPPTTVAGIETGAIRPQPVTLRRLSEALGLEPAALRDELCATRRRRGLSRGLSPGAGLGSWR